MAYSSLEVHDHLDVRVRRGFRAYLLPPYAVGTVYGSGCAYPRASPRRPRCTSPPRPGLSGASWPRTPCGCGRAQCRRCRAAPPSSAWSSGNACGEEDGRGSAETSPRGSVRVASVSNRREQDGNDARLEKITRGETLSRRARGWRRRGPPRTCTGASRASCLKARSWSMDPGSERRRARPQWQPRGRKRRARSLTTETRSLLSFLTLIIRRCARGEEELLFGFAAARLE